MSSKKKNIHAFIGNNLPSRQETTMKWVSFFVQKHGEHNVSRWQIGQVENMAFQEMATPSLLGENRLFILSLEAKKKKAWWSNEDEKSTKKTQKKQKGINWELLFQNLPDSNFLLLVGDELEEDLEKLVEKYATLKEFFLPPRSEIPDYIRKKLPNITPKALNQLVEMIPCYQEKRRVFEYIPGSFEELSQAILQLSLYKEDAPIEKEDLQHIQSSERVETEIFTAINAFCDGRPFEACMLLENSLKTSSNISNSFIGSLRRSIYIQMLLAQGKTENDLVNLLKWNIYSYQMEKKRTHAFPKMVALFNRIIDDLAKMRNGELIAGSEENILLFIQKTIFSVSIR